MHRRLIASLLLALPTAGIATDAENPDGAQRLIEFLSSAAAAETIAETGLEPAGVD